MGVWIRYFIGTPRRFTVTAIVVAVVTVIFNPSILVIAINRLVAAIMPLLGPALVVLIVFAGLRMIVRGGK